jgi:hypothetical protein
MMGGPTFRKLLEQSYKLLEDRGCVHVHTESTFQVASVLHSRSTGAAQQDVGDVHLDVAPAVVNHTKPRHSSPQNQDLLLSSPELDDCCGDVAHAPCDSYSAEGRRKAMSGSALRQETHLLTTMLKSVKSVKLPPGSLLQAGHVSQEHAARVRATPSHVSPSQ